MGIEAYRFGFKGKVLGWNSETLLQNSCTFKTSFSLLLLKVAPRNLICIARKGADLQLPVPTRRRGKRLSNLFVEIRSGKSATAFSL